MLFFNNISVGRLLDNGKYNALRIENMRPLICVRKGEENE